MTGCNIVQYPGWWSDVRREAVSSSDLGCELDYNRALFKASSSALISVGISRLALLSRSPWLDRFERSHLVFYHLLEFIIRRMFSCAKSKLTSSVSETVHITVRTTFSLDSVQFALDPPKFIHLLPYQFSQLWSDFYAEMTVYGIRAPATDRLAIVLMVSVS